MRISLNVLLASIYYERLPKTFVRITRSIIEPGYARVKRLIDAVRDLFPPVTLIDAGDGKENNAQHFVVAGRGDVRGFFFQRLFGREPIGETCSRTSIWKVISIDADSTTATLIEADRCFGRLLARQGFVAIPEWILFKLDISASWTEIERNWHRRIYTNLRKVYKYEYHYDTTTDLDQLRYFYDRMYQPYISLRYGKNAADVSFSYMQNMLERGVLLFVHCNGEAIAGFLIWTVQRKEPMVAFMGIKDADPLLLKRGASSALYYYCVHWAKEQGYLSLDFGHTRPFLEDGLLMWKKRWGMQIQRSDRKYRSLYLLLRNRNAEFERFLVENPLVCEERGQVRALVCLASQEKSTEFRNLPKDNNYFVQGLQGARILPLGSVR